MPYQYSSNKWYTPHDIPGNKTLVFGLERVLKDHLLQFFLSTEKDERVKWLHRGHTAFWPVYLLVVEAESSKQGTARDITENLSKLKDEEAYLRMLSEEGKLCRFLHPFLLTSQPLTHPASPSTMLWSGQPLPPIALQPLHKEMERWEGAQGSGCRHRGYPGRSPNHASGK